MFVHPLLGRPFMTIKKPVFGIKIGVYTMVWPVERLGPLSGWIYH